jgi:hypothetical protein
MTVPLIVLAVLATVAGFIGLPHLSSTNLPAFTHALASWLDRSVVSNFVDAASKNPPIAGHAADSTTFLLMAIALAVGALGIALAWMFYGKGPTPTVTRLVEGPLQGAYQASKAKLWFDEIYDATIVRPFRWLAQGLFAIVDRWVIDRIAVTGFAFVVGLAGRISRWFQNGQVQRYLAGLVVGAAAVFFITDCKSKTTFEVTRVGDELVLHASPGAGVAAVGTKLAWDITGDGVPDNDPSTGQPLQGPDVRLRAGDVPSTTITLIVEDPVTRKISRISQKLELAGPAPTVPREGN